jgi:hypothetical protein
MDIAVWHYETHQVGSYGNPYDLYSGRPRFECWPAHWLAWLTSSFSLVPPDTCQDSTLNYAAAASCHMLSNSFTVIQSFDTLSCELMTASLNKLQMNGINKSFTMKTTLLSTNYSTRRYYKDLRQGKTKFVHSPNPRAPIKTSIHPARKQSRIA